MSITVYDRVKETTTTTGSGTLTLAGAAVNFQAFSVVGDGNQTYYAIVDDTNNVWEVGIGTYTASGTTLSRTTILASSNSGSIVSLPSGTKDVFLPMPATLGNNIVSAGSPPTIVQVAGSTTGGATVTMGTAPVSGNLLVCMGFNPSSPSAGTGWTSEATNINGQDYGFVLSKIAGGSETTTQTPLAGAPGSGGLVIWEIHGQAATAPIFNAQSQSEQTTNPNVSPSIPNLANVLTLQACGMTDTSKTITALLNSNQDLLINTGTRILVAGHATVGTSSLGQFLTKFSSGTPNSKSAICSVSSV